MIIIMMLAALMNFMLFCPVLDAADNALAPRSAFERGELSENGVLNIPLFEKILSGVAVKLSQKFGTPLEVIIFGGSRYQQSGERPDIDVAIVGVNINTGDSLTDREEVVWMNQVAGKFLGEALQPFGGVVTQNEGVNPLDYTNHRIDFFDGSSRDLDLVFYSEWKQFAQAQIVSTRVRLGYDSFDQSDPSLVLNGYMQAMYYFGDPGEYSQALRRFKSVERLRPLARLVAKGCDPSFLRLLRAKRSRYEELYRLLEKPAPQMLDAVVEKARQPVLASKKSHARSDRLVETLRKQDPFRIFELLRASDLEPDGHFKRLLEVSKDWQDGLQYTATNNSAANHTMILMEMARRGWPLRGERVLEIGVAGGTFLAELCDTLGMEAIGLESNPLFVDFALQEGLPVVEGNLFQLPSELTDQRFYLTVGRWVLDALAWNEPDRMAMRRDELQALVNLSALTERNGYSIQQVEPAFGEIFSEEEYRRSGFAVEVHDMVHGLIVLRKVSEPDRDFLDNVETRPGNVRILQWMRSAAVESRVASGNLLQRMVQALGSKKVGNLAVTEEQLKQWIHGDRNLSAMHATLGSPIPRSGLDTLNRFTRMLATLNVAA